ncbi:hypothetical protein BDZ97DRAFT_1779651 [Flammula alnicola]|nr:hypothetical protein BDZ97DRAFT_1779651 [Flammula alnicola]
MHSATQIIAQRAPPAIRTKPRWQPYYSIPAPNTALPMRSPTTTTHFNTPLSHVPPPQDSSHSGPSVKEQTRQPPPTPIVQTPKDSSQRDTSKHKFAAGLIDQAVHTLSEIWRPQDVPDVFKAPSSKGPTGFSSALAGTIPCPKQQLLNDLTRSTSAATIMAHQTPSSTTQALLASGSDTDGNLVPMKTFVHEVLKRSRTSGSILQAALCYLEAIRPKVPQILREEKMGVRAHYQPETKILPATEAELAREAELAAMEESLDTQGFQKDDAHLEQSTTSDDLKTVRVTDSEAGDLDSMEQLVDGDDVSIDSLLFFQDKCYSNRAWAKLSGLPPREIGRCERALGQALEWRLWVGKSPIQKQTSSPPARAISDLKRSFVLATPPVATSLFSAPPPVPPPSIVISADEDQEMFSDDQKMDPQVKFPPKPINESHRPQFSEKSASTPSPDTPGLTYSPSSTDSSGDRTIQMSTFETTLSDARCGSIPVDAPFSFGGNCKDGVYSASNGLGFDLCRTNSKRRPISIVDPELAPFGLHLGNCLWHADNRCISLEPTGHSIEAFGMVELVDPLAILHDVSVAELLGQAI